MSEYRVYTIGPDGHIFKAEPMICENEEEAITPGRLLQNTRLKSAAATAS